MQISLNDKETLMVNSSYDSGIHTGVHINIIDKASYGRGITLDKLLDNNQIKDLEVLIAYTGMQYLKGK